MPVLKDGSESIGRTTFHILALTLIPRSHAFWDTAGIYCPPICNGPIIGNPQQ